VSSDLITDGIKTWWEQKSGTRGDSRAFHLRYYHILTSSVVYNLTDARQHVMENFIVKRRQGVKPLETNRGRGNLEQYYFRKKDE